MRGKRLLWLGGLAGLGWAVRRAAPGLLERGINRVLQPPPYAVGERARALHRRAFIADLHADSLVTGRNLLRRATRGHVDLPRLLEGNVGLQVFGLVTKTPLGMHVHSSATRDGPDLLTGAVLLSGWPRPAWGSLLERALYQCARLRGFAQDSAGQLILVGNRAELEDLLARRAAGQAVCGAFAGLEGAHALQGRLENLECLYQAGTRMLGLTHFFDNPAGGSAHGVSQAGLTRFGRDLVAQAQTRGILVDLAHASPQMVEDTLQISRAPLVVSHTGVRATLDSPRNLSDAQIRAVADSGGVIGIALFQAALGGKDMRAAARAMRHTANVGGAACVALGSDFDGGVTTFTDASGLALLTEALLEEGFGEEDVLGILGGNFLRVLRAVWGT